MSIERDDENARGGLPARPVIVHRRERGAAAIMVAVAIVVLFSFAVLGLDLAIVMTTKTQLQNAADAAALAGASGLATGSQSEARERAIGIASNNRAVLTTQQPVVITAADISFPAANEIRVTTHRTSATGDPLRTYFLRFLDPSSTNTANVTASATASVVDVCVVGCVKPWAIPDRWDDVNANGELDAGEPYDPAATGYEAPRDVGMRVVLKQGDPHLTIAPGVFFPVCFPPLGGEERPITGGSAYREWIGDCAPYPIAVGDSLLIQPGNLAGPTRQGAGDLIALDPDAYWDSSERTVAGSAYGRSPRTVIVPIFAPTLAPESGRTAVVITKIGAFFVESTGPGNQVNGRFMQLAAPGTACSENGTEGSFVKSFGLIR